MTLKTQRAREARAVLQWYLEETFDALFSMVVDHADGCPVGAAAERLMALAGWTEDDLARIAVERAVL